jgi:hypothetical protein
MSASPQFYLPGPYFVSLKRWARTAANEDTPIRHIMGIVLSRLSELSPEQLSATLAKIKTDRDWPDVLNELGPPKDYDES